MMDAICLLNNRALFEKYERAQGPQKQALLFEMARRVGTRHAMLDELYANDAQFRASVDDDTVRLFRQYKLNGGQDDTY